MKIDVRSFSLSLAITGFVFFLVLGVWFSATGFGKPIVEMAVSFYANILHLSYNPIGSFWSNLSANFRSVMLLALFTEIDGAVLGFLFSSLYNLMIPKEK